MTERIVFEIPAAPPTVNHYHGHAGNRVFLTQKAREFHALVKGVLNGAKLPGSWNYCAVNLVITPPRRRCDVDNRIKILLDAFTRAGYWGDDEQVASIAVEFRAPEKGNRAGRTIVEITKDDEKYKGEK